MKPTHSAMSLTQLSGTKARLARASAHPCDASCRSHSACRRNPDSSNRKREQRRRLSIIDKT
eukprot:1163288-Pyramimonas_sp.AAC.1